MLRPSKHSEPFFSNPLETISREIPYESVKISFRERVSPCVAVLGLLAALVLPGAVIQSGHAPILRQTPFLAKALDGTNLSR